MYIFIYRKKKDLKIVYNDYFLWRYYNNYFFWVDLYILEFL